MESWCVRQKKYWSMFRFENSATGTRTRVARVRTEYPNQLDYSGSDARRSLFDVKPNDHEQRKPNGFFMQVAMYFAMPCQLEKLVSKVATRVRQILSWHDLQKVANALYFHDQPIITSRMHSLRLAFFGLTSHAWCCEFFVLWKSPVPGGIFHRLLG